MLEVRDGLREQIDAAAGAYGAYVAGLALAVAADFARTAAAAQLDAGALDFDDLLGRARDLLAGARGADPARVAAVRGHFQRRYRYLLVDEFQDTDPLQAEIAFLLAEREPTARTWREVELQPGKLFLVGDAKQSIYRFRRADIAMYDEVAELVAAPGRRGPLPRAELPHRVVDRRLGQRRLRRPAGLRSAAAVCSRPTIVLRPSGPMAGPRVTSWSCAPPARSRALPTTSGIADVDDVESASDDAGSRRRERHPTTPRPPPARPPSALRSCAAARPR